MRPAILRQGAFVLRQQNHHVPEGHPVPVLVPRAAWRTSLAAETLVFMTCVDLMSDEDAALANTMKALYSCNRKAIDLIGSNV